MLKSFVSLGLGDTALGESSGSPKANAKHPHAPSALNRSATPGNLATSMQPLEETDPTSLAFFHALSCTKDLAVAGLVHCNGYKNDYTLILSAIVTARINLIHIDIQIPTALQKAVLPMLNVYIPWRRIRSVSQLHTTRKLNSMTF